jgi:outer membrane protein assembly factor BamB
LVSVSRDAGLPRWRIALPPRRPGEAPPAIAGGPIVIDDHIIVTAHDGGMHAFARSTGTHEWSQPAEPSGGEAGADFRPVVAVSGVVIAGSLSGAVAAFEPGTGREIWRRQPSDASVAFALGAGPRSVYVPYVSGLVVALDAADGREQWRTGGHAAGFRWPPAIDKGLLFLAGASSGFVCIRQRAERERA